jgi:hypothetical protein
MNASTSSCRPLRTSTSGHFFLWRTRDSPTNRCRLLTTVFLPIHLLGFPRHFIQRDALACGCQGLLFVTRTASTFICASCPSICNGWPCFLTARAPPHVPLKQTHFHDAQNWDLHCHVTDSLTATCTFNITPRNTVVCVGKCFSLTPLLYLESVVTQIS